MAVTSTAGLARPHWWPGVAAWVLWALVMLGLAVVLWMDRLMIRAGRADLAVLVPGSIVGPAVAVLSAATVGRCWPAAAPATPWAGCCWASPCR
jgi:hypothetical protein